MLKHYWDIEIISGSEASRPNCTQGGGLVDNQAVLEALLYGYQVPELCYLSSLDIKALDYDKLSGESTLPLNTISL